MESKVEEFYDDFSARFVEDIAQGYERIQRQLKIGKSYGSTVRRNR